MVTLHKNIIINSTKQNSAQGSVFYCKSSTDYEQESVLKIYKEDDIKSYIKEMAVFNCITEQQRLGQSEKFIGYPKLLSALRGPNSAEILMEALGANLRKLLKELPGGVFSKPTVYKITIQLVSKLYFFILLFSRFNDCALCIVLGSCIMT